MPCGCNKDIPEVQDTSIWGSALWSILHILAEQSGKKTNLLQQDNERRAWQQFVPAITDVIPCPDCRQHFIQLLRDSPFVLPNEYAGFNTYIRDWFYNAHELVNQRLGKPSFLKELLSETYGNTSQLSISLSVFIVTVEKIVFLNTSTKVNLHQFTNSLKILRAML